MKRKIMILTSVLLLGATGFANTNDKVMQNLNAIEAQYNELLRREEERKNQMIQEQAQLEQEVEELKRRGEDREEKFEKLRVDSEVRWHRNDYKKILSQYETYYKRLDKLIAEKEAKIEEIKTVLSIMN